VAGPQLALKLTEKVWMSTIAVSACRGRGVEFSEATSRQPDDGILI